MKNLYSLLRWCKFYLLNHNLKEMILFYIIQGPLLIGSSSGGVNIEEMTDSIVTDPVDIDNGNTLVLKEIYLSYLITF